MAQKYLRMPILKNTPERVTTIVYTRWRISWSIWKSEKSCADNLTARRAFASLEHRDAYNAVKHLKIEEKLNANHETLIATLDDAVVFDEDEEKYTRLNRIVGDKQKSDNMRSLA